MLVKLTIKDESVKSAMLDDVAHKDFAVRDFERNEVCDLLCGERLRILWLMNIDYQSGINHGGNLRFFNLARWMVAAGHQVFFGLQTNADDERERKRAFLETLMQDKTISGYDEIAYRHPRARGKLARLAVHPSLSNAVLRTRRAEVFAQVSKIVKRDNINIIINSNRDFAFLLHQANFLPPVIADWTDSFTLYGWRQLKLSCRRKDWRTVAGSARFMFDALVQESFYSARARLNLVVSPIDKAWLDKINHQPQKNHVLLNGVTTQAVSEATKVGGRLIFTGNMSFPPNYEAAMWFSDYVMPLLIKRFKDVRFIVAGANPVEELKRRASDRVEITGFVKDINAEIRRSAVYVAPLVSGGGFKNKIVEAMTNAVPIVASPMAIEFLDTRVSESIAVSKTAEDFAVKIGDCLMNPERYEQRAAKLKLLVDKEFSWEMRAAELIKLCCKCLEK